mgnify:CR=1 FL=1
MARRSSRWPLAELYRCDECEQVLEPIGIPSDPGIAGEQCPRLDGDVRCVGRLRAVPERVIHGFVYRCMWCRELRLKGDSCQCGVAGWAADIFEPVDLSAASEEP